MSARFIVLHPRKLVYAELPKCASTTMHRVFLEVSGIRTDLEPHYPIWRERFADARREAGLESLEVPDGSLAEFVRSHRGYRFFSVVRDPYSRCLSGYRQQVRRYAKRFHRIAYARAKLRKLLSPRLPGDVANPHRVVTETLHRTISLEQFVAGLGRHGTSFDKHFDLQSNVIRFGQVPYDVLVRMEDLAAGLRGIFTEEGDLATIPFINVTGAGAAVAQLAPDTKRAIHALYAKDFMNLGYPA